MEEEGRAELARGLYEALPEDARGRFRELTEGVCRETGVDPTPAFVEEAMLEVLSRFAADAEAKVGEITAEEFDRAIGEEYDRLCADPELGVEEEELVDAVRDRLAREHAYLFARRRKRR